MNPLLYSSRRTVSHGPGPLSLSAVELSFLPYPFHVVSRALISLRIQQSTSSSPKIILKSRASSHDRIIMRVAVCIFCWKEERVSSGSEFHHLFLQLAGVYVNSVWRFEAGVIPTCLSGCIRSVARYPWTSLSSAAWEVVGYAPYFKRLKPVLAVLLLFSIYYFGKCSASWSNTPSQACRYFPCCLRSVLQTAQHMALVTKSLRPPDTKLCSWCKGVWHPVSLK